MQRSFSWQLTGTLKRTPLECKSLSYIPNIGRLLSEKFDGIRVLWDGATSKFVTRHAKTINAPNWFKQLMPEKGKFDGELWFVTHHALFDIARMGRQHLDSCKSLLKESSPAWKSATFQVFDTLDNQEQPFHIRFELLKQQIRPNRHLKIVEQQECRSVEHLREVFSTIIEGGGEGIMLRNPDSAYIPCRSFTLQRLKVFSQFCITLSAAATAPKLGCCFRIKEKIRQIHLQMREVCKSTNILFNL